ncbi:hypothetical protein VTO73DRAFT_11345 [Trametes versicolor]
MLPRDAQQSPALSGTPTSPDALPLHPPHPSADDRVLAESLRVSQESDTGPSTLTLQNEAMSGLIEGDTLPTTPTDSPTLGAHAAASPADPTDTTPRLSTAARGSSNIGHQTQAAEPVATIDGLALTQSDLDWIGSIGESDASLPSTPSRSPGRSSTCFAPKTPVSSSQAEVHPGVRIRKRARMSDSPKQNALNVNSPTSGTLSEKLLRTRTKARATLPHALGQRATAPTSLPAQRLFAVRLASPASVPTTVAEPATSHGTLPAQGAPGQQAAPEADQLMPGAAVTNVAPLEGPAGLDNEDDWAEDYKQYLAEAKRTFFARRAERAAATAMQQVAALANAPVGGGPHHGPSAAPGGGVTAYRKPYSSLEGWDGGASASSTPAATTSSATQAQQQIRTVQTLLARPCAATTAPQAAVQNARLEGWNDCAPTPSTPIAQATLAAAPAQHLNTAPLPALLPALEQNLTPAQQQIRAVQSMLQRRGTTLSAPYDARTHGPPTEQAAPKEMSTSLDDMDIDAPELAQQSLTMTEPAHEDWQHLAAAAPATSPALAGKRAGATERADAAREPELLPDLSAVPANWAQMLNDSGVLAVMCEPEGGFPDFHGIGFDCALEGMSLRKWENWRVLKPNVDVILFVHEQTDFYGRQGYLKAILASITRAVQKITGETGFEVCKPDKENVEVQDGVFGKAWLIRNLSAFGVALFRTQSCWPMDDITLQLISTYQGLSRYVASYKGFSNGVDKSIREALRDTFRERGELQTLARLLRISDGDKPGVDYDLEAEKVIMDMEIKIYRERRPKRKQNDDEEETTEEGDYIASLYCDPPVREAHHGDWFDWCQNVANFSIKSAYDDPADPWRPARCSGCHGCDHDRINCPFARIPGWNGALKVNFNENGADFTTEAPLLPNAQDQRKRTQPTPNDPNFCYYRNPQQQADDAYWQQTLPLTNAVTFAPQWKPPRSQKQPKQNFHASGGPTHGYAVAYPAHGTGMHNTTYQSRRNANDGDVRAPFAGGSYAGMGMHPAPANNGYATARSAHANEGHVNARAGPSNAGYVSARPTPQMGYYANAPAGPSNGNYMRTNARGAGYGGAPPDSGYNTYRPGPPPPYDGGRGPMPQNPGPKGGRRLSKYPPGYPPFEDRTLKILNTYAPNEAPANAAFWRTLEETNLGRVDLLLGDLNVVEDRADRLPPREDPEAPREALQALCGKLTLLDGWRITQPLEKGFTYMQESTASQSRLDRIYVRRAMAKDCSEWGIVEPGIPTDHLLVTVAIENYKAPFIGKGRWVMQPHLLEDEDLKKTMLALGAQLCRRIEGMVTRTPENNPQKAYTDFKTELVHAARMRAREKIPKIQKRMERLRKDLAETLNPPEGSEQLPLNEGARVERAAVLQDRLTKLEQKRFGWKRKEVAARHWAQSETMTKYWMRGNTTPEVTEVMYTMLQPGADPPTYTNHSKTMAKIARDFYNDLQEDDPLEEGENHEAYIDEALYDTDARLTNEAKADLAQALTRDDVADAIKDAAQGKAPGLDGLPTEVWKAYSRWHAAAIKRGAPAVDLPKAMMRVFNDIEKHGIIQDSDFAHGWICPVYKLKKDKREIGNYRPITLLNSDYKIMTKALASKLAIVAPALIHHDQAGFIPGRRIFDHIKLSQLMIEYAEAEEINGAIVALDQEKAYDKVDHEYLWRTMRHMNFPENFIRTLKNLYAGAQSCVIINGVKSALFNIVRGVRQGDPISCLIFDIAIEPLACALRRSSLRGLSVPGETERLIAKLFADDTTVYLSSNDEYAEVQSVTGRWCRAARARFNVEKTEILPIGSPEYRQEVIATRRLSPDGSPIPATVHIVKDGEAIRSLGAWIGNGIDLASPWVPVIATIETNLAKWAKGKPTLNGRKLAIGVELAGRTQFRAMVQTMPESVEKQLTKIMLSFLWNGDAHPRVAREILHEPIGRGGLKLLNIKARNDAINLMWLKTYLGVGLKRPIWTLLADALLAHVEC